MTLTEFLLARIAEDERRARDCFGDDVSLGAWTGWVLAEGEVKRLIVDLHFKGEAWCDHCRPDACGTCPTIQLLALPYADHPDYRAAAQQGGWDKPSRQAR